VKLGPDPVQPVITSIADVPNDDGRVATIRFRRSGYDVDAPTLPVTAYEVYRRDAAAPATSSQYPDAQALRAPGWTFVGSMPAHGEPGYAIDSPTIGDSTIALGDYRSVFRIRAATANPGVFYYSAPDSGCSIDNVAPGMPLNVMYNNHRMIWGESTAKDFDYYSVYGSNTSSFGTATLIGYTTMDRFDASASPHVFYFITATDFSGNEGNPAVVNTLSAVNGAPASCVLSISAYPNPFNPTTTIRYTVPSKGHVGVAIYDARGARVATLFDGERSVGAYTVHWNGRAARGAPVSSGVYFARITHAQGTKSYKMILLK
jgi:hypothetical protein